MEKITEIELRLKVQSETENETHNQVVEDWYKCKRDISWLNLEPSVDALEGFRSCQFIVNGRRHTISSITIDVDVKALVLDLSQLWPRNTKIRAFDTEGWEHIKTKVVRETLKRKPRGPSPKKALHDDDEDEDDY